ncbi:hypothetical protein [Micromonospora sp. NPDC023644]|uniref:hypothetical protein n=1 Tax=Micromonospora sp. NPDC023644 TaxID=3154321 RepID=UPI0033FF9339
MNARAVVPAFRSAAHDRLSIHETADLDAVLKWWVRRLDLPPERFQRASLKKHRAATVRRNVGDDYRGCLEITVPRSRELYWRIEGMITELFQTVGRREPNLR